MAQDFVTRFAPSPTGRLHLGHAYSALVAFDAARAAGGQFLLRIEDIDETRCKRAFEDAIYEDLKWLGLDWASPVLRQSEHLSDYRAVIDQLATEGLVYRCFKTRKEVADAISRAPHQKPESRTTYTGEALQPDEEEARLAKGAPFAWRLSLKACRERLGAAYHDMRFIVDDIGWDSAGGKDAGEQEAAEAKTVKADPTPFGDAVIGRKEGGVAYHLACVFDDARQGVTHVIRGQDLAEAAHLHVLLQKLLDAPTPIYRHHPLLTDADGKRLAKRDKAATISDLRENGATPGDIRRRLDL
ncbi:MAG: tRNA glutamyl-Q(34) synthetase GluQRS [Pseudomonadota bacterium]